MGGSEMDKQDKEPKTPPSVSVAEQLPATSTVAGNPEWSGFQAYAPVPPPGFMATNPQAHPYMWGVQHMMPPYGTPPHPYVAMYPQGAYYAHPSIPPGSYPYAPFAIPSPNGMAEASGNNTHGSAEADTKPPEGKEKLPVKRKSGTLGSLNMITGKNNGEGKTTRTVVNGARSKSAESGSDGSSEGSDANSQNDSPRVSEGRQEVGEAVTQNGDSAHIIQNGVVTAPHTMVNHALPVMPMAGPGAGAVGCPATNLNIGMEYWGAPASSNIPAMQGTVSTGMVSAGSRDNVQSQLWLQPLQDERELKRQRRKQSNRESARRSRLRKQAECDELAQRAEVLQNENANLRSELNRIKNDYDLLMIENSALKAKLVETPEDLGPRQAELRLVNETQESTKTDQGQNGR